MKWSAHTKVTSPATKYSTIWHDYLRPKPQTVHEILWQSCGTFSTTNKAHKEAYHGGIHIVKFEVHTAHQLSIETQYEIINSTLLLVVFLFQIPICHAHWVPSLIHGSAFVPLSRNVSDENVCLSIILEHNSNTKIWLHNFWFLTNRWDHDGGLEF